MVFVEFSKVDILFVAVFLLIRLGAGGLGTRLFLLFLFALICTLLLFLIVFTLFVQFGIVM